MFEKNRLPPDVTLKVADELRGDVSAEFLILIHNPSFLFFLIHNFSF